MRLRDSGRRCPSPMEQCCRPLEKALGKFNQQGCLNTFCCCLGAIKPKGGEMTTTENTGYETPRSQGGGHRIALRATQGSTQLNQERGELGVRRARASIMVFVGRSRQQ